MPALSRRDRTAIVAGIAAAGLLVTAGGVYAVLSASASNTTPLAVDSGTLSLVLGDNGASFGTPVTDMAPGDVVRRHVSLTNNGALEGQSLALQVTDSLGTVLSSDAVRGLQIAVDECSVAWTAATGACSGTTTPAIASTALAGFGTQAFGDALMSVGEVRHLQLRITLPDSTEETVNGVLPASTVQGLAADLTWRFSEAQRTATDTSS